MSDNATRFEAWTYLWCLKESELNNRANYWENRHYLLLVTPSSSKRIKCNRSQIVFLTWFTPPLKLLFLGRSWLSISASRQSHPSSVCALHTQRVPDSECHLQLSSVHPLSASLELPRVWCLASYFHLPVFTHLYIMFSHCCWATLRDSSPLWLVVSVQPPASMLLWEHLHLSVGLARCWIASPACGPPPHVLLPPHRALLVVLCAPLSPHSSLCTCTSPA